MSADTSTLRSTSTRTGSDAEPAVRPDVECWARASEFLTELIGSPPDDLVWDGTFHLQGHLQGHGQFSGLELIVIAPRDDDHETVVLTADDWDAVRHASSPQRRDLLEACAIANRNQLAGVLSVHRSAGNLLGNAA